MASARRVAAVLAGGLAVVLTADALRARARLRRLPVLPAAGPGEADGHEAGPTDFTAVTAAGVAVPGDVLTAGVEHARSEGLDVVDLVPGDLGPEEALELAAQVDPASYRDDRLALGRGPFQALLVRSSLLERSRVVETDDLDPVAFVDADTELKHLAPTGCDLVIAGGLTTRALDVDRRGALLRALFGDAAPVVLALPVVQWSTILAGLVLAPSWGAVALAAYCSQPVIATAGSGLAGAGVGRHAALRWCLEPLRWWGTVTGGWAPPPEPDPVAVRRAGYAEELAGGVERFSEPRRADCPLCGSERLEVRLRTTDVFQYKPGRFVLERCRSCGHVFQNPRLSEAGLDFYYRDFYDGLGEQSTELIFGATDRSYVDRAEMMLGRDRPLRWLDVGAGHGHFCLIARDVWPDTAFDGLDLSDSIEEAERRGWVDRGHRGLFVDKAASLADHYDVVSMHHYLEHTREPQAELDAVAAALRPGGHVLIELPDPESPFGTLLGRWWIPWFQPQHQHLLSVGNLERLLAERGFDVVEVHRAEAHQTVDVAIAAWLRANDLGRPEMPWLPPRTAVGRWRRRAVLVAAGPVFLLAAVLDQLAAPIVRARGGSNTYRVLARLRAED